MIIKRRNSTFETNSSSAHTIAVCKTKNKMEDELKNFEESLDSEGNLILTPEDKSTLDFSWGFALYDTWFPKLMYVIGDLYLKELDIVPKILSKASPKFKKIKNFSSWEEDSNINDQPLSDDYVNFIFDDIIEISIDHQSVGTLRDGLPEAILGTKKYEHTDIHSQEYIDLLFDFVFNPAYVLIIDSDCSDNTLEDINYMVRNKGIGNLDKLLDQHWNDKKSRFIYKFEEYKTPKGGDIE